MNRQISLTLTEFLESTGSQVRFYDLGRRVNALPKALFLAFERAELAYPYPMQQKAWFAMVQEPTDTANEPVIWFLRLDLDEQGKLVQATRDYLIRRFIESAARQRQGTDPGEAMRDNPYAFAPREDKMANFHAVLQRDLGLPPSQYFEHACDYLSGRPGWEQWSFVGYQGLADIAARQEDPALAALLTGAIPHLPDEPLIALSQCLENHPPAPDLARALNERLGSATQDAAARPVLLASLLRALSLADPALLGSAVLRVLELAQASDPEVLAAIAGRCWPALRDPALAHHYLERLASDEVEGQLFTHCVSDLLRLPEMRESILGVLRSENRSSRLATAFDRLLSG
ncbi:MAG: DUF3549 family protein [Gammaproteobacteria bacterium]|nr:MAG: DUF3549 family protein [Gammaproteobacteria bacterium]